MLTKLSEAVSIIDTHALGIPSIIAAYVVTGKEIAIIDMGYQSSAEGGLLARPASEPALRKHWRIQRPNSQLSPLWSGSLVVSKCDSGRCSYDEIVPEGREHEKCPIDCALRSS